MADMTREDAIFFLNELRSANRCDETIDMAIAALRGPQPDPETGLVPCQNCGAKAVYDTVERKPPFRDGEVLVQVWCPNGCISTCFSVNAKETWNRAMGYKEGA